MVELGHVGHDPERVIDQLERVLAGFNDHATPGGVGQDKVLLGVAKGHVGVDVAH